MKRSLAGKIYHSRYHLAAMFVVLILPFLFLLVFSKVAHITTSLLFTDVLVSTLRLFVAYVIAAAVGWLCAVAFYRGGRAKVALPIFDVLQSFPTFAALPLATYLWGTSGITVIIFLVVTIVWPIFFSIVASFKSIKHDWYEAVSVMGLRGTKYLRYFLLPISLPALITGSVIGLGEGWEALVATEIIVQLKTGLGSFFQGYAQNPTITVFGILGFLILIFSINKLVWMPLLEWGHRMLAE